MQRKILLPFALVLFLFITTIASASEYSTTDGYGWLKYSETAFSTPLDPKVACEPNNNHCLMLVYENNSFFGRGVKIKYSTDNFYAFFGTQEVGSYLVDYSNYKTVSTTGVQLHYPYDVIYDSDINKYKIIIGSASSTTQKYYYSTSSGLENNGTIDQLAPIGFINSNSYVALQGKVSGATAYLLSLRIYWNNTNTSISSVSLGGCVSTTGITKSMGFVAPTTSTYIYYGSGIGGCGVQGNLNNFPAFPTTYTGLDYYEGSIIGYQNNNNASWRTTTSDLSAFTGTTEYYQWSSETINHTDSTITTKNQIWAYEREGSSANGIWVYKLGTTPIEIWGEGCDPYTRSCANVNLSVNLNCTLFNTTTARSGQFVSLTTACQTDNIITVNAADPYYPVAYYFANFSFPASCYQKQNYIKTTASKGYYKAYNFTIKFKDKFFGNDIQSVTAIYNGATKTTNSAGETSFNTFPIDSPSFTAEAFDTPSCTQTVSFTGTPKQNSLIASKAGYQTLTDSFAIARDPFVIETDFDTFKLEYIEPTNTQIEVFLYSKDGIGLHPSRVTVNVTAGSNDTYYKISNQLYHQSYGTQTPAKFYLFNNTGTYNVTVAADYFKVYTHTATVTTGDYQAIRIYIDQNSWELPCFTSSDCGATLCLGQYLKSFSGCQDNVCTYTTEDCGSAPFCDTTQGCVDILGVTNCTSDNDCNNTCADSNRMIIGLCGADGYCKGRYADCLRGCNATISFCEEYRNCLYPQKKEFRAGYTTQAGEWIGGTTATALCDLQKYQKHFCIIENTFNITEDEIRAFGWNDFSNVIVSPQGWKGKLIANGNAQYIGWYGYNLQLEAVSGYCDDYCNLTYEYCANGCDVNSGMCKGIIMNVNQPSLTGGFWEWYNMVIPDLTTRMLLWFFYGIIIMLAVWGVMMKFVPKKANLHLTTTWEIFGIILLAWILMGSLIGQFPWYVWLILAVIAIAYIAQWASKRKDK
jgi:hypothetical protein